MKRGWRRRAFPLPPRSGGEGSGVGDSLLNKHTPHPVLRFARTTLPTTLGVGGGELETLWCLPGVPYGRREFQRCPQGLFRRRRGGEGCVVRCAGRRLLRAGRAVRL